MLVFFLRRQHDPALFHVALSKVIAVNTHRTIRVSPQGHRIDVCFREADMNQFNLIKETGFDFQGTIYKPVIPIPDDDSIVKVSLRQIPSTFFSKGKLEDLFSPFGTVLQAGVYYNDCGNNIRAFTGAGYILIQLNPQTQATQIPSSFNVGLDLPLQARVVKTSPPTIPETKLSTVSQESSGNHQSTQSQDTSPKSRRGNGRKRNNRGKAKNEMEGIESTNSGSVPPATPATPPPATPHPDTPPLGSSPTKASHIRFPDPEESGTVATMHKTPPAVSVNPDQTQNSSPDSWTKNQTDQDYREHQLSEDEDEGIETSSTITTSGRLCRTAAPQPGTLNLKQLAHRALFGRQ